MAFGKAVTSFQESLRDLASDATYAQDPLVNEPLTRFWLVGWLEKRKMEE